MSRVNGFIGRRELLKAVGLGGAGFAVATGGLLWTAQQALEPEPANAQQRPRPVDPDASLKRMMDGNQRFVQQKRASPNQSQLRLQETAQAQYPFAAMLSCADSRVPSEIVFDQGVGDLFVVRVAGNVVTPETIGSLEFSSAVLGSQLIMVLGHERCGAVAAAVKGDPLPGRIGSFVETIKPAVERVRGRPGDAVENAVIANVQYQVSLLKENSVILAQLIRDGKLKIVGGRYDLDTGEVRIIA
ncbi:carbonic anhydrase [Leptolyngbya sp. FACHB-261]|uniref:carbonic anhydrase n=1 Tax=Leptolyngbya sp. FACHB-261 TaxID=2692806 RepID=UPI0016879FD7|nr:carbonic anhydrase [Leptolyngbya sp. FACHB-261]MBD2100466.1 carbonic anhydrase [Leptolyngbya sp. FACHB-261]